MKNHFPEGYCPQREKVLDLSRSVLTGNRRFARYRRNHGRYMAKVERQISRDQLRRAASWMCICGGDVTVDCPRCYNDDMPTIRETCAGIRALKVLGVWDVYEGFADDLAQLFRWYHDHVEGMDHYEAEAYLRAMFLCSPFGHSVKTRHAFDHLFEDIVRYRLKNYTPQAKYWCGGVQYMWPFNEDGMAVTRAASRGASG